MVRISALLSVSMLFGMLLAAPSDTFHKSFITSYDLSGRYTHEYHPFILKKTKESFLELEQSLRDAQFSVDGRMIIIGYQEDAVPPYTTQWTRQAIDDEVIVKTAAGLSQPTRNIFGFMTGFLLKDAEWLERFWYKDTKRSYVSHILARPIPLFNDQAVIFQKHAFGKDFSTLLETRKYLEKALYKKDFKGVLGELIGFWSTMYQHASTTGSQEMVGTQDMLFSIDYARALREGQAPLKKIFVGPDVTYPIEVLSCQKEKATANAQEFIRVFQQEVQPIDDKNTAYIFCSFVDGVGKSTLLNNIKNWGNYGDHFEQYERCDNSSSQEASVYKLKDKVFLVDLPAQISHFTIKPDGFVFVDIQTVKDITPALKNELMNHIMQQKDELTHEAETLKKRIATEPKALYEDADPVSQYLLNCHIFQGQELEWIPLTYKDRQYLFNKLQPQQIRTLVTLAGVHSMGLKIVEPEQMLFSLGLSLPMQYTAFLDDLKKKLRQVEVEHVVFIDFLSMYPRSSRENIRVNFILQYLKKIFGDTYILKNSFYGHHVYKEQGICHLLTTKLPTAIDMVVLETALRWALYELLENKSKEALTLLCGKELEEKLHAKTKALLKEYSSVLYEEARERLEPDQALYHQKYALDRIYEVIVRFSMTPVMLFNDLMLSLFAKGVTIPYFRSLWEGMEGAFTPVLTPTGKVQVRVALDTGVDAEIRSLVHQDAREFGALKDIVQSVRAQWYALLSSVLSLSVIDGEYRMEKLEYYVPPLVLKRGLNGYIFALQRRLPLIDPSSIENIESPMKYHIVNVPGKQRRWGLFAGVPHCMEWENPGTFFGIYAYGYNPFKTPKNVITQLVERYKQQLTRSGKQQWGMPTSELYRQIVQQGLLPKIKQEISGQHKGKLTEIKPEKIPLVQLWIRMIATLEMILKDMRSEVFIRKGNKEDFLAAVRLLEFITLPLYFGLEAKAPLFADYTAVEPVIPWDRITAE
jgi:hypothetical protein